MTSSSAHQPGTAPRESSRASAEPIGPPSDAVTLCDLIADSGPLPADAALECVQRLAELLNGAPHLDCRTLGPSDVLIDDDGGVWLTQHTASESPTEGSARSGRMDRLGRLLAFLATGEDGHLSDGFLSDAASAPSPIATAAAKLLTRNGSDCRSYAELARDAAGLQEPEPAVASLLVETDEQPPAVSADASAGELSERFDEPVTEDVDPEQVDSEQVDSEQEVTLEPETIASELPSEQSVATEEAAPVIETEQPVVEPEQSSSEHIVSEPETPPVNREESKTVVPASESRTTITASSSDAESSWLGVGIAVAAAAGAAVAYVIWQLL